MERELSRRGLQVITISFNGPADDPAKHAEILSNAKIAMTFLKQSRRRTPGGFLAFTRREQIRGRIRHHVPFL